MVRLPSRQVHLDFHTSEFMDGVGSRFSKENFQEALKLGNLNSITVFAKCHHSWCYYPTEAGRMHPTLKFDLAGAMIEAAHEIGVRAPIYITVGWSASDAENHPEWVVKNKDGTMAVMNYDLDAKPEDKKPIVSWKFLCPNGGYAELIYEHTREICERYSNVDGLFYDICFGPVCWCDSCVEGMNSEGLDPEDEEDAKLYHRMKWQRFMSRCNEILHGKYPEATVFYNGGADPNHPEWHDWQTHFEMEDLPTTWGGYDKMPPRARYFARSGKDYLGMTGKFHTMWGEFGGFKPAAALKYECAAMMAFGARCSIGDQAHPSMEMDVETYRLIGEAYRYAETIEPWCFDAEVTTRLGIIPSKDPKSDEGLVRMLMENQLDFDIIHEDGALDGYDVIILPDKVLLDDEQAERINTFIANGGGVLLTGKSGLNKGMKHFVVDTGTNYQGPSLFENDYLQVGEELSENMVKSPVLFYEGAEKVCVTDAKVLATLKEPCFNRTYGHYCSHQNTPYKLEDADYPGAVTKGKVVYLAHPVCRMYYEHGSQFQRQYFINALKLIYPNQVVKVKIPSSGRINFVRQPAENRYVLHVLYATPIQRGRTSVIEDMPPIYNVNCEMTVKENIKSVTLEPQGEEIPYVQENDTVKVTIPKVECHQMIVLSY